jgi:branched-chain amino acid aminotransferase
VIYLNNRLVPLSRAKISVFDRGFLYGDGIYETLRVYKGVVFKIHEHIERLFRSASMIGLKIPKTHAAIKLAVYKTIQNNKHNEAYVRISISRGPGPIGLDPEFCKKPTFVVVSKKLKGYPPKYYKNGVKVAIVTIRRNYKKALNPQIKSLNFLNNILAKIEAKAQGAYEAIMLNYKGYIAEGTITNIFFLKDNILHTPAPSVGILNGITRQIIIDSAKKLNIKTRQGKYVPRDIYEAGEVFISNTTMEIMPVTQVDKIKIGRRAGEVTGALHQAYKEHVSHYLGNARKH